MSTAPAEADRLAAVRRLGLLDTVAETRFDRLVDLAATVLGTPIALVSLIDQDRQWFKARVGLDVAETARDIAICAHAIEAPGPGPFVVNDTVVDARFADNPLVTDDPRIRFYAGQVVRDRDGFAVGTLCVIDRRPRHLDDDQRRVLAHLAALVEEELQRGHERDLMVELALSEQKKSLIVDNLIEGLVLQDNDGRIVEWNRSAGRVLGLSGDELAGRTSVDSRWLATHADGSPWPGVTHPAMVALRTGRPASAAAMGVHRPDGTRVWLSVNAQPIIDESGSTTGVLSVFADVTAEWNAKRLSDELTERLRRSEEMARVSLDSLEQGVILADRSGAIHRINPAAQLMLGYTADELTSLWRGGEWIGYDEHDVPIPLEERAVVRALRTGQPVIGEVVNLRRADGRRITARLSCVPNADGHGDGKLVIAISDITEHHRLMQALTRFQYLFERANDVILVIDDTGTARYASPSLTRIIGVATDDPHLAATVRQRMHPDDRPLVRRMLDALRDGREGAEPVIARVRDGNNDWRYLEFVGVNLLDEPSVAGIVLTARDITDRELLTRQLAHRADHDALTDLPNRTVFETALSSALARTERDGHRIAVCYVDLDRFKNINDSLGHDAGDRVLTLAAGRLRAAIRAGDTPARFGGDEFVALLDPVGGPADAHVIASRIRDTLVDVKNTLGTAEVLGFGASVGVALNSPGDTAATLVKRADDALYRAKRRHNSAVHVAHT